MMFLRVRNEKNLIRYAYDGDYFFDYKKESIPTTYFRDSHRITRCIPKWFTFIYYRGEMVWREQGKMSKTNVLEFIEKHKEKVIENGR
tara:strand:+ start:1723 stop:1986 length:264 start_codon:yes stop_codon:yes gene_type:complete